MPAALPQNIYDPERIVLLCSQVFNPTLRSAHRKEVVFHSCDDLNGGGEETHTHTPLNIVNKHENEILRRGVRGEGVCVCVCVCVGVDVDVCVCVC